MAKELKLRDGTKVEHETFVGAESEVTINTTNKSIHIHDGIAAGGFEAARVDLTNIDNAAFAAKASAAGISGGGGGGTVEGADPNASYITISAEATLPNERRLQAGNGVVISDGGAGGAVSVSANFGAIAPANLGAAAVGSATTVSRSDHVHAMPTATQVGAVPVARTITAGLGLSGGGALSSNLTLSLNASIDDLTNVALASVVNGDLLVYNGATSQFENYPASSLARSTVKYEGNAVGLANAITSFNFTGNGVSVLTDGSSTAVRIDVQKSMTAEEVQDIVGGMVSGNTESGITVTYDDATEGTGKINFQTANFAITLAGVVQGTATVSNLGNVTINTTTTANAITLGTDTTGNYVKTVAAAASPNGITVTGAAGEGTDVTVALNVADSSFIEAVQDIVGGMVTGNTENGIAVTYFDDVGLGGGKLNFQTPNTTVTLTGVVTGAATIANGSSITISTSLGADQVALGTHTTGNYVATVAQAAIANGIVVTGTAGEGTATTVGLDLAAPTFVEGVEDIAASLFSRATHSGISVVYDDAAAKITLDVNDFTLTLAGAVTGAATVTDLGSVTLTTAYAANSITLGTHTVGNYVGTVVSAPTSNGITISGLAGEGTDVTVGLNLADTNFIEGIQDIIGGMVTGNTENGITVTYFDDVGAGGGKLNFQTPNTTVTLTGAVTGSNTISNGASIIIATTPAADSITLGTHTVGNYVATVAAAATANGIVVTGAAAEGTATTIGLDLAAATFVEGVEDIVAGLFSRATHSGISAVYDDALAKITLDVSDFTFTLDGAVTGAATVTNLGSTTLTTTLAANSVTLGTHSVGNYVATITGSNGISVTGSGSETAAVALTIDGTNTSFQEIIQDIVGTMVTNGTKTKMTATYTDGGVGLGTLNFAVVDGSGSGLNADLLDGYNTSQALAASTIPVRDSAGYLYGNRFYVADSEGLYTASGSIFYNAADGWWSRSRSTLNTAITLTTSEGTRRGAIYADSTGNVGLLNPSGNWRFRTSATAVLFTPDGGSEFTLWHSGNMGSGSGLNADTVRGNAPSAAASANTMALRDGSGDIYATTFRGVATSAQYADVAERYAADAIYEPGTVMVFGGSEEITQCQRLDDTRLAGVVSTEPAYMMNSDAGSDETHPYLALVGRVPCKVKGPIRKGDLLTTSNVPGHAEAVSNPKLGSIVGKALENFDGDLGVIEISVQRS